MRSGPKPAFLKSRVAYYVAGLEAWHYADDLQAIARETRVPIAFTPDHYTYDPLSEKTDAIVYTSEPYADAITVAGDPRLVVWITADVPDTDFEVAMSEILPNGKAIPLADQQLRARYRESLESEKLLTPGEPARFEFHLNWFARQIGKGSRLRVTLTSPNAMDVEKDYNSGGVVADESGADARVAHIRILQDPRHQSFLQLPVELPAHAAPAAR
ncbi:MAG TPA: CocE/NonD family hydrolase [Thermoanaerobaculia bacterium]|nr:CocE/NonD family hydrolase [Thermoanaerobaculia bacterium]